MREGSRVTARPYAADRSGLERTPEGPSVTENFVFAPGGLSYILAVHYGASHSPANSVSA